MLMFSSNQILELSGSLSNSSELKSALEFALDYSGNDKNMQKSEIDIGYKLVYQITNDGKYCIGWCFGSVPSGWLEYPFKFDVEIVSKIIKQHLEKFPVKEGTWIGSYNKGFIMKFISADCYEIESPSYGIVYFKPYTCFYVK